MVYIAPEAADARKVTIQALKDRGLEVSGYSIRPFYEWSISIELINQVAFSQNKEIKMILNITQKHFPCLGC